MNKFHFWSKLKHQLKLSISKMRGKMIDPIKMSKKFAPMKGVFLDFLK